jgi:hypothetical protein
MIMKNIVNQLMTPQKARPITLIVSIEIPGKRREIMYIAVQKASVVSTLSLFGIQEKRANDPDRQASNNRCECSVEPSRDILRSGY